MITSLTELIQKYDLKITGVIHAGGNTGEEAGEYKQCGVERIVYFEPDKESAMSIGGEVYTCALGDKKGSLPLWRSYPNPMSSSLLEPLLHKFYYPEIQFLKGGEVEVRTLDSFGFEGYNFLNIDTNGYELHVLRGAVKTLPAIDYIYLEIYARELYRGCPHYTDIDNYLDKFIRVETWWTNKGFGDALYIRQ